MSVETGKPDYLNSLISIKEFVSRQLSFIMKLQDIDFNWSSDFINLNESRNILKKILLYNNKCIKQVFGMYIIENAIETATKCILYIYNETQFLLTDKIKSLIFSCNSNKYIQY